MLGGSDSSKSKWLETFIKKLSDIGKKKGGVAVYFDKHDINGSLIGELVHLIKQILPSGQLFSSQQMHLHLIQIRSTIGIQRAATLSTGDRSSDSR